LTSEKPSFGKRRRKTHTEKDDGRDERDDMIVVIFSRSIPSQANELSVLLRKV